MAVPHHELGAAVAGHEVARPYESVYPSGDRLDDLITAGEAERLVHPLEMVEVGEEDGGPRRGIVGLEEELLVQEGPVGEAGGVVVESRPPQLVL